MLRTAFLSLILVVSLSSTSLLRKSVSRRQSEPQYCQAIEGFDCKCSHYRVSCTTDRDLPQQISVLEGEKQKYQSIELVINGERDQNVNEYTFEPVKQLFKADADNLEFRVKFEKFTALHLSASVFNRVYPENLPATARKNMALEIYNPLVQPNDNVNLFANLNVDSLEIYVLYPFRGTFQQLFNGANIKSLRLSGVDIRSDSSQPFTGNIGRLELAKQASQLTAQNFPVYPAHELIINAFYLTDFNSDNPPNYSNLGELRIHTTERVPANAFRQYPNLHTLSISTEKEIDPQALNGLHKLEKLTIKDTKPSLELLNSVPSVKEFEASVEKLDDREQCQLIEKLANGQVVVQAIPSGRECTCASAYLDAASGRYPCDAQNCDQSSCAAIKNNYDASTRTFKTPPAIKRSDGSDALRQRDAKVYNGPFQVSSQDQEKLQQGASQQQPDGQQQQPVESVTQAGQSKKSRRTRPRTSPTTPVSDVQQNVDEQNPGQREQPYDPSQQQPEQPYDPSQQQPEQPYDPSQPQTNPPYHPDPNAQGEPEQGETTTPAEGSENQQGEGNQNRQEGEGVENPSGEGVHEHHPHHESNQTADALEPMNSHVQPAKKGFGWLPIIIIAAVAGAILLIVLIAIIVRRRKANRRYTPAATNERAAPPKA